MAPSIRIRYNSPVILTFVLISLGALALAKLTSGQSNALVFSVYNSSTQDPLTYVRMIAHVFGHADWTHFSSNIMFMLLLGPILEEKYGSLNLSIIIFVTALITGLIQFFFFNGALLGASGVVFSFIILTSMTGTDKGGIPLTFLVVSGIYLGGEIYNMVAVTDNISQITHVIGGLVGALGGFVLKPKLVKIKTEEKPIYTPVTNYEPIFPNNSPTAPGSAPFGSQNTPEVNFDAFDFTLPDIKSEADPKENKDDKPMI